MWVSGSFEFGDQATLKVGQEVECRTVVESVKERTGKDGRVGWYVQQRREMTPLGGEGGELAVVERRTHLFRAPFLEQAKQSNMVKKIVQEKETAAVSRKESDFQFDFLPTPNLLFRFSALTFNTHRIHWVSLKSSLIQISSISLNHPLKFPGRELRRRSRRSRRYATLLSPFCAINPNPSHIPQV